MDNIKEHDEIRKSIIDIVSRITRIDRSGISDTVLIREELGIDSLMAIEIVANIEKHFTISVDESLLQDVQTVGNFISLIESIINKNS